VRYALLIYGDEKIWQARGPEEGAQILREYEDFAGGLAGKGRMRGGEPLVGISSATTVRVREGKVLTTDGPFAETKEQLGGFFIVECDDLDQAIEAAAGIPDARVGSIEVRPVMEIPGRADITELDHPPV
jgi:hypothetical protein